MCPYGKLALFLLIFFVLCCVFRVGVISLCCVMLYMQKQTNMADVQFGPKIFSRDKGVIELAISPFYKIFEKNFDATMQRISKTFWGFKHLLSLRLVFNFNT